MSDGRDPDLVEVVNRRADVLDALADPRRKRDLVAELGRSRSTIDRAVRELDALGLVARDDGYHRTVAGRLVLELYRGFLSDLDDVAAASGVLRPLPPDAPMSLAMLRGASIHVADHPSPAAALDPLLDLYDRAERIRGLSIARTRPELGDRLYELLTEEDAEAEVVYDYSLADHLLETDPRYEELVALESFSLSRHPDLPYGLGIVTSPSGDTAFLIAYDDESTVQGVVVNDTPAASNWAGGVFERYRAEADPLSLP